MERRVQRQRIGTRLDLRDQASRMGEQRVAELRARGPGGTGFQRNTEDQPPRRWRQGTPARRDRRHSFINTADDYELLTNLQKEDMIIPVEVKAETNIRSQSLKAYCDKFHQAT